MNRILVIYESVDRTGFTTREEVTYDDLQVVVEDIVSVRHIKGYGVSETMKDQIRNFWKYNRKDRLIDYGGLENLRITIDFT